MALIKPAPGITDIKGGFGGTYFTKDGSGLHQNVKPRHVKGAISDALKNQRAWYTSKKYAEKVEYPEFPNPDEEIPPGTHVIYSLDTIWAHRQPSLFAPTQTQATPFGFWPNQIQQWVNNNYDVGWLVWGFSKELMFWMTLKWYYVWSGTKGFGAAVSFAAAKANMLTWISAHAAAVAVPALTLWIGLVGLQFYFAIVDFLAGVEASISFTTGRVVIRKDTTLWFGGLVARPSQKFYDFTVCQISPFEGMTRKSIFTRHPYRINFFYSSELWQSTEYSFPFHYVYTWQTKRGRLRGKGYKITNNRIRMQVNESQHDYWDKPIGWNQSNAAACAYLDQFEGHWMWPGHPADPL